MRYDKEQGGYVEIPSFCIDEYIDDEGYVYGLYRKGDPGCEAPMIEKSEDDEEDEEESEDESEENVLAEPSLEEEEIRDESEYVLIRRTYDDLEDKESYKKGNDSKAGDGEQIVKDYYFESKCLQYDALGVFDEEATLNTCKLLTAGENGAEVVISDGSYGDNGEGRKTLQFKASVSINPAVFLTVNKHMMVNGPSHRNVTDSYEQVSPIFKEREKIVNEEDGE